jgi:zinc finger protein
MSTNCNDCGYRDNEIKSGAAISEQGKKIILKVEDRDDLSRDILKVSAYFFSLRSFDSIVSCTRATRAVLAYRR